MNDIELIDEIVKRAEEHQRQKEIRFAIKELVKLKDKLIVEWMNKGEYFGIDAINERIIELKEELHEI